MAHKRKYDVCDNEIHCNGITIAYIDHSPLDIKDPEVFGNAIWELAVDVGYLVQHANAYSNLKERMDLLVDQVSDYAVRLTELSGPNGDDGAYLRKILKNCEAMK